jgi:hypothetical protein
VKNLLPDTFVVPADYKKLMPAPPIGGAHGSAAAPPASH